MFDGVAAQVDQRLVQQREEGGEPRFGMLHVSREYALEGLACSAAMAGRGERAARLMGAATSLRATLGTEQWTTAFTAGQVLSLAEAIAEAFGEEDHPGHTSA